MQRHVHADRGRKVAGPQAAAEHNVVCVDTALFRRHAGYLSLVLMNRSDFAVLDDLNAALACPFGQCLCNVDRVGVAVGGNVDTTDDVICVQQRRTVPDLGLA